MRTLGRRFVSIKLILALGVFSLFLNACQSQNKNKRDASKIDLTLAGQKLMSESRQLTISGSRSGEGYFSPDGREIVFQSERQDDNPFYQIYHMDLVTGERKRVSPGFGKTTCAWIHPSKKKILFSSTHLDPNAKKKQKAEIDFRNSGKKRRYSWDYDEHYDIFAKDLKTGRFRRLTREKGYDAEGSYSPDGKWIAFASNRDGYKGNLSAEEKAKFVKDPSYLMDIYIMNSNGGEVRQLTTHKGYDGGPFFSPDGKRITWRRFTPDGHQAEIWTMNVDGTDKKQITKLGAMSWAPFYHPSGDYLIFTTNKHGYQNFELYIVDADGKREPVRASFTPGFDGLPVFLPNGRELSWSRKKSSGDSQIFIAGWDDALARKLLKLPAAKPQMEAMTPEIRLSDLKGYIRYLASAKLRGRATGSEEEKEYTKVLADLFEKMGLKPAGGSSSFFHEFDFVSSVQMGEKNELQVNGEKLDSKNWRPLELSKVGKFLVRDAVFVGFGIKAPAAGEFKAYDSFADADVKDKWVVLLEDLPSGVEPKTRVHLNRFARIEHKVMLAGHRGAAGVIVIGKEKSDQSRKIGAATGQSTQGEIPVIQVTEQIAEKWFENAGASKSSSFKELRKKLNDGVVVEAVSLKGLNLTGLVDIRREKSKGRSVLAMLKVPGASSTLMIGAHGDHLGVGESRSSLRKVSDESEVHYGADDNASGVSLVMEAAHWLSHRKKVLKKNIVFAVWSGEELGNLGSAGFAKSSQFKKLKVDSYINLDMVGRLKESLNVQGVASSSDWERHLSKFTVRDTVPFQLQKDPYLPTDASSLYLAGVPVVSLFTGAHEDYHSPRDTAEKINYEGLLKIGNLLNQLSLSVASEKSEMKYHKVNASKKQRTNRKFRIYLGTVPDYTNKSTKGVLLSGVSKNGPAEKAGLLAGDRIVKFGDYKISTIYDYVYTLEAFNPGEEMTIVVVRGGREKSLKITPTAR